MIVLFTHNMLMNNMAFIILTIQLGVEYADQQAMITSMA